MLNGSDYPHPDSTFPHSAEAIATAFAGLDEALVRQVTADNCARKGMEHGLQKVEVFVKGPGSGRETAIRSLTAAGLEVGSIQDVTPSPHNGVRPPKRRRV
mgnify:CR=1 FL=1